MARQEIEHNRRRRDRRFQHQIVAIDLDADAGGALGTKIKPVNIKLAVISQLPRMRLATPNHVPLKTYFTAIQTAVDVKTTTVPPNARTSRTSPNSHRRDFLIG